MQDLETVLLWPWKSKWIAKTKDTYQSKRLIKTDSVKIVLIRSYLWSVFSCIWTLFTQWRNEWLNKQRLTKHTEYKKTSNSMMIFGQSVFLNLLLVKRWQFLSGNFNVFLGKNIWRKKRQKMTFSRLLHIVFCISNTVYINIKVLPKIDFKLKRKV